MSLKSEFNIILAVNAGSSSLKISVYLFDNHSSKDELKSILESSFSNISSPPALFSFESLEKGTGIASVRKSEVHQVSTHEQAFAHFLHHSKEAAKIDPNRISYVCHRVVHGGSFSEPVTITPNTYHKLEMLSDLAPL